MVIGIVAMAHGGVIGSKNDLPWYLPADLKHFKELTTGHPVVMGRKTFESIVARLGHGLPNRTNIVVTRDKNYQAQGAVVVHSIEEALKEAKEVDQDKIVIMGGEQIYRLALPFINQLEITEVDADIPGDTFFPELDKQEWAETDRKSYQKDDRNPYDYSFVTLSRR